MEFGQEGFFIERFAGAQQFEKRIFGVVSGAVGFEIDGVRNQRTRRSFELRSSSGLAGQELDKFADALALLFGAVGKFNAHAASGMHHSNQAFGVNLKRGRSEE